MKIFHTENGKEVVYVQMQDIMYLSNETDIPIPVTIFTKVFAGVTIVDDSNRFKFVKFDDEHEVEFFKNLKFIIDFNQYKNLTDEQLEEEGKELATQANEIAKKWNSMTEEERKQNSFPYDDHRNLSYMIKFLAEIYDVKHGKRTMPFPDFIKLPEKPKKKLFPFFRRKKDVK